MKHKWLIHITSKKAFDKFFKGLTTKERLAIFQSLAELAQSDCPHMIPGVTKLKVLPCHYRQRQGDYRIIFHLETGEIVHLNCSYRGTVHIDKIEHRKSVYNA